MQSVIVFVAILGLVVSAGCYSYRLQKRRLLERQQRGVETSRQLLEIIRAVQQHRGISSAVLGGKEDQRQSLISLENNIDSQLKVLVVQLEQLQEGCGESILKQWQRLRSGWHKMEVLQNFQHHCGLLSELLATMQDISDHCALSSAVQEDQRLLAQQSFAQLPVMIENLGQLRALSTHAAVRNDCITSSRLHLQFLVDQLSRQHTQQEQHLARQIHQVLELISKEILQAERIDINPDQLFSMISQVMEQGYREIDSGVSKLTRAYSI